MMGHVMTLLIRFVEEQGGPQAVARAFEHAGLERVDYRFDTAYPEQDFARLLGASVATLGATSQQAELGFAEFFMRVSPELFPAMFRQSGNARTMLERIPHLHRSIPAANSRGALLNKLSIERSDPDELVYRYDSPHRLCLFLRRSCELVLKHYGESGTVTERACVHTGAPACLVAVRFEGPLRPQ